VPWNRKIIATGKDQLIMDNTYTPIECDLHDELLARATLKQRSEIVYNNEYGERIAISDYIEDVYSHDHAEYIRFRNGTTIRLDALIQVDTIQFRR
jgi:Rho-binding antiterminator